MRRITTNGITYIRRIGFIKPRAKNIRQDLCLYQICRKKGYFFNWWEQWQR
jgi:hypothetical protein